MVHHHDFGCKVKVLVFFTTVKAFTKYQFYLSTNFHNMKDCNKTTIMIVTVV